VTDDPTHWSARRTAFGSQAEAYASGRPSYPLDAVRWTLPDGAHDVLDLAAGTGRLTERLLELGLDVVAVEPLDDMRAHIPAPARALAGTAEQIPLPDASVDAVTVGQAFHWFDVPRAMAEIMRVLRPGGRLALFWNMLDDRDPWVDRLSEHIQAEERFSILRNHVIDPYEPVDGMGAAQHDLFEHAETYDADRLVAFIGSRSQTILAPAADRDTMLEAVRAMCPEGEFPLPLVCSAFRADRV
jgi:SAM-dependent methyltransferase